MRDFYQKHMYGIWRDGETVSFQLESDHKVRIFVEFSGKTVDFTVTLYLPENDAKEKFHGKCPFLICMHPIQSKDYALSQGYAVFFMDSYQIASDNCEHVGCFYELYPYGSEPESQTGVLMAWAWGASKVLDAVYAGLDQAAGLDALGAMVTGVSRWGKATAVCGAFDPRFAMTIPACSGAGGLALYNCKSTGKTYNFQSIGGPSEYTYGENEPLSCLQSDAERGWFIDSFTQYRTEEEIPVNQYMLPVMAASPERYYFIIGAYMGEDWVNSPAMWECYKKAEKLYAQKGLSNHLAVHFHKEGHAVLTEDMKLLIAYFNEMHYGIPSGINRQEFKTAIFDEALVSSSLL